MKQQSYFHKPSFYFALANTIALGSLLLDEEKNLTLIVTHLVLLAYFVSELVYNPYQKLIDVQKELIQSMEQTLDMISEDFKGYRKRSMEFYIGILPMFHEIILAMGEEDNLGIKHDEDMERLKKIVEHQASYIGALELESDALRTKLEEMKEKEKNNA